jgi:hypothetical protein
MFKKLRKVFLKYKTMKGIILAGRIRLGAIVTI